RLAEPCRIEGTRTPIVRPGTCDETSAPPAHPIECGLHGERYMRNTQLKVLLLGPRPRDQAALLLKDEVQRIIYRLPRLGVADRVELRDEWAVRFTDLTGLLLQHQPHVVHISGHGAEGLMAFEDDAGATELVREEALLRFLESEPARRNL